MERALALVLPTVYNNSAVATKHAINTLVGTLKPLSSDTRIKGGIDDAIQALKTRDANKALLLLNQARNGINHQLTNLPISRSNSTLRSNNNSNIVTSRTVASLSFTCPPCNKFKTLLCKKVVVL